MPFFDLETPALILDAGRLEANAIRMRDHCASLGVTLRPHVKTPKSVDVAKVATGGRMSTITVSTVAEAEYFATAGFDDILYAVGIAPNKFARLARIRAETGKTVILTLDSAEMATAVAASGLDNPVVIEVDCGEHRGGLAPGDPVVADIAALLGDRIIGVMTHGGQSYASDDAAEIRRIAKAEVDAAVTVADQLRAAGIDVSVVSIGSTPTVQHAESLDGVTEVRAGIYLLYDLSQYSRNICRLEDIAVSVLASVIGHNRAAGVMTLDSGGLALSKDLGANAYMPDAKYGLVCDVDTLQPLGVCVNIVHQEHGTVRVEDPALYDRLPIGSLVRVLPNHACMTVAGGYGKYHLTDGRVWDRIDGW